ncbi:MAG: SoxR reducing system RseC family protein [Magnetococcales bacterium]|nr:SoxR reducing system RseC family protein [Magnetococcales bacterium]MBF0156107.1 SoxR reducing system RseC family protein [Magnetococcales bacterium]
MLQENGWVISVDGDHALVGSQPKAACGGCHSASSCSALSFGAGNRLIEVKVLNTVGARAGDRVILEVEESRFLRASLLVYGIPLVALVVGALLVASLAGFLGVESEAAEGVGAVAGLVFAFSSFGLFRRIAGIGGRDSLCEPTIREVVDGLPVRDAAQGGCG